LPPRPVRFNIDHPSFFTVVQKTWTLLELLRWTSQYLAEKSIPEPRLTGELLLAGTLGLKRLDLYLQFDRPLRPEELERFKARLRRRVRREPLQYIEGTAAFRDLTLLVDRRVLIPRPETEVLVGEVLRWAEGRDGLEALDVGTGTGAIALSLAAEGAFAAVVATDLSADALEVARENHRRNPAATPVAFRQGSAYEPVRGERFDVIVSNPPYIGLDERPTLEPEVREWEPGMALFSGADGLEVIRTLVREAPDHLRPGGLLALEIGAGQGSRVLELVRSVPCLVDPRLRSDLAGRDRIVLAERAPSAPTL
jgi:release factor glutamine methyltransferase